MRSRAAPSPRPSTRSIGLRSNPSGPAAERSAGLSPQGVRERRAWSAALRIMDADGERNALAAQRHPTLLEMRQTFAKGVTDRLAQDHFARRRPRSEARCRVDGVAERGEVLHIVIADDADIGEAGMTAALIGRRGPAAPS